MPKRRAGREHDLLDGTAEYVMVPIGDLKEDPDNPRKIYRNIAELGQNLKEHGLLQPVVARVDKDGNLIIMWGHRRVRAAKGIGWTHIRTIIRYGVQDSSVLAGQLIENSLREDVDPMDEARAVRRWMRQEKISTQLEAAQRLGHSLTWVSNRLMLLNLDQQQADAVSGGTLGIVAAAKIARQATGNTRTSRGSNGSSAPNGNKYSLTRDPVILPYFSSAHALASTARARCKALSHGLAKPKIGAVACGECWEDAIRNDATRRFALTGSGLVKKGGE
jgi:ParB family chromosome partitioning protein